MSCQSTTTCIHVQIEVSPGMGGLLLWQCILCNVQFLRLWWVHVAIFAYLVQYYNLSVTLQSECTLGARHDLLYLFSFTPCINSWWITASCNVNCIVCISSWIPYMYQIDFKHFDFSVIWRMNQVSPLWFQKLGISCIQVTIWLK